jgi:hypothetical protein
MANNVRCAGGGSPRRKAVAPAPCGWKGERYGRYQPAHPELVGPGQWVIDPDKPCPHCGGRVKLIERVSA